MAIARIGAVKTAEPIDMQFEMLSGVDPGNMYYVRTYRCVMGRDIFGSVWPIEKHRVPKA